MAERFTRRELFRRAIAAVGTAGIVTGLYRAGNDREKLRNSGQDDLGRLLPP